MRISQLASCLAAWGLATWGLATWGLATLCVLPAGAQTQMEMNQAAADRSHALDARLNDKFQILVGKLVPKGSAALRTAERSWVKFRDDECAFNASGVLGGSIYPMIYSTCLERLTGDRLKQVEAYLSCKEGDRCPGGL